MGQGYVRRKIASAPARILLDLLYAPEAANTELHRLTQEGIAHDIRSGRSTVAKALLRLAALDLIAGKRAHVPGHRLRKHVYRLTSAGGDEALRERARLERAVVQVSGLGERDLGVRAGELPELFPSAGDLSQILARVKWGALSAQDLDERDSEPCLPPTWGPERPQPKTLINRVPDAKRLDSWLASKSQLLSVTGLAGIGKTALVAAAVGKWRTRYALYWSVVRQWSSRDALTADLAKFLVAAGRKGLERALADRGQPGEAMVAELLRYGFRGLRAILVFDDVHVARPAVRRWFDFLAHAIESTPCRIVLVGRVSVGPGDRGRQQARPQELRVGPLDGRATVDLLRHYGMDPDDPLTTRIAREARGNPLLLTLGAKAGPAAGREISRFLEDEVWSLLTRVERRMLEAACCLRRSAPTRALLAIPEAGAEALRQLERKNLLDRTANGMVAIHSSIKEFVRGRTTAKRMRACHAAAMRYFLSVPHPGAKLEAIHHALEAGLPNVAADLLRHEGEALFNSVSFAELRDLLEPIDPTLLPPTAGAVLAEAKGDALRRGGSIRPASARYNQALRLADPVQQRGDRARILRKLAELDRFAGLHARAENRLAEAARTVDLEADPLEASNMHREYALLEMARGSLAAAEDHLKRALHAARKGRDSARFSRALLVFGTLEAARGQPEVGLRRKVQALRHAQASGELLEVARDATSVGVSHAELKQFSEALPYYEQGLRIARLLGDVRLIALAQVNRAGALLDLGRWAEAGPALAEADRLSGLLGERVPRGFIAINMGQLEMGKGHWRRAVDAFELGLQTLRSCAGPFDLARGLIYVGDFYVQRGEHALAMERWEEALGLADGLGNKGLMSEVSRKLSLIQETNAVPSLTLGKGHATSAALPGDHRC